MIDKYKLLGKIAIPCMDLLEWGRWFQTADRSVAKTQVGPLWVSTVFLGLDHRMIGTGDPILFETMVFGGDASSEWGDSYQERYSTWGEAEAGHARAVEWAKAKLAEADASLKQTAKGEG